MEDNTNFKIVVAEDQLHNMQAIKNQMSRLGKFEQCEFCYNGQEALLRVSELLTNGY